MNAQQQAPALGDWPADAVQRRSVASLVPYARNARKHSASQIDQIAQSIVSYGFTVPVLVDEDGGIIAGHGRVMAAKKLGLQMVPTMTATGWTAEKKRAYVLLDNKLALNSEWDTDLLKVELDGLQAADFTLGDVGFSADEFAKLSGVDVGAPVTRESHGLGKSVIQFNIVFDDENQQATWFALIRKLKTTYPDEQTLGARLQRLIQEQGLAAPAT